MKTCILFLLMFATLIHPCSAQDTSYSKEISVREQYALRLKGIVKGLENRKGLILKSEKEYKSYLAARSDVDRKVQAIQKSDRDQQRPSRVFDRAYNRERNHLTEALGLKAPGGKESIRGYQDLVRWIAVYEKDRPKRERELEQIERDLSKARADLNRTEKELAALKGARGVVAGKAAIEGHWILPGRKGYNLIYVNYNEKDRVFYGTVIKSDNLICHPAGTILFELTPSTVSDTIFSGTEYGYDYDPANDKCRPARAKLSISVRGSTMTYDNGSQRLILTRMKEKSHSPTVPMKHPDETDPFFNL